MRSVKLMPASCIFENGTYVDSFQITIDALRGSV